MWQKTMKQNSIFYYAERVTKYVWISLFVLIFLGKCLTHKRPRGKTADTHVSKHRLNCKWNKDRDGDWDRLIYSIRMCFVSEIRYITGKSMTLRILILFTHCVTVQRAITPSRSRSTFRLHTHPHRSTLIKVGLYHFSKVQGNAAHSDPLH